jgi:lysophospholipase
MWSEHKLVSFDGTPIFFRRLTSRGRVKGAVMLIHGMGEHGGRYKEFSEYLASQGFNSCLPDLRGFGLSGGRRGSARRFEYFLMDLDAVHRAVRSWEGGELFFLGHSFGGLVTAEFVASGRVQAKGMILSSPNFGIKVKIPLWARFFAPLASALVPDLSQPNNVDRATLTHDLMYLLKHKTDPLIHDRISPRLYTELSARIHRSKATAGRIKVPSLILQAGDDRVVSRQATELFYDNLASEDKKYEAYPGLFHEILNETSRQVIYAQIAAWLARRA